MSKKLIGIIASFALVLSVGFATTASALTAGDISMLQAAGIISAAQAASLSASIAAPAVSTSGYAFAKDLTLGAKGADVTALQQILVNDGYLVMPSGAAYGYFGSLTKSAVIKYQLAKGITPAAGYFGSKTRAILASASGPVSGGTVVGGGVVVSGTDLSVSLAATSPMASALVAGQSVANLAEFTFVNKSAAPAVVTNITLQRVGVSGDTAMSNVYLYNGAVRLTDSASVSSGKITFNAAAGIFTVPAGSSLTVSVKSDIADASGQLVGVALTGVTASIPVSAVYPISGSSMSVFSSTDIAKATSTLSSSITGDITVLAGSQNQTIWSTNMTLSGRAVYLKSLALKVIGSIPTNSLQNVKLYVAGVQVASAMGMDANGMLTFDLTGAPYKIDSSRTIEVRADVVSGSSRTFSVSLQNASDLMIVDSNYNVGITAGLFGIQSSGKFTVNGTAGGYVTVQADTSLSAGDIITGASNVLLGKYTMKAYGEDIKISYLQASSTDQLDNVTLYANGVQIGSTQTISTVGAAKLYSIGSSLIIPAGTSVTVEIKGDIKYNGVNATTTGSDVTVMVALSGYANNAQGSYSSQLSTVPNGTINGPLMTVKAAGITFSANPAYGTQTMVPSTNNVKIGSYVFKTNSSEAVRVTNLTVTLGGAAGVVTNVSNLRTSESVSDVKGSPTASNNFNVDFTVPANSSKTIDVYADLSVTTGVASTTMALSAYGVDSNTTITQAAVTGQTINVGAGSLAVPTLKTGAGYAKAAQFVVASSTSVIGTYNFASTNGDSMITELTFAASSTAADIVSVSVDGKSAPMSGGVVTISGLSKVITTGTVSSNNVPVTVTYNSVGNNGGATSNTSVGLRLTGMKYTSGNSTVSTTTLAVDTNLMRLVGSKPVISFVDISKNGVVSGTREIARITVSADRAGDVDLLTLPLSSRASGAGSATASTSLQVYANDTLLVAGTDYTNSLGAIGTTSVATGAISFIGGYPISSTEPVTFKIYSPVTINAATYDGISTSIGAASLFTWKDVVGDATTTGSLIYNYPSADSSTLNY